jgi:hypothetical protein
MAYSTQERERIYTHVCTAIAEGRALREICREDIGMVPSIETIRAWLLDDADFSARYARAREAQAEHYADEIVSIADTEPDAARARNRIDARKWKASKMAPKVYGDRLQLDGELSISLTNAQLDARIAHLFGKAGASGAAGGAGSAGSATEVLRDVPGDGGSTS